MRGSEVEKSVDDLIRLTKERMAENISRTFKSAVALGPAGSPAVGALVDLLQVTQVLAYDQVRLKALLEVKALFQKRKR